MPLQLQSFSTLIQNMAAATQAAANTILDLSVGSVSRALLEANASVALWLQWLLVQVLQATRASTSTGADLDSWMADFSLSRLSANSAVGSVTFSRNTTGFPSVIPVGAVVRTSDASQSFAVSAVPSIPNWLPDGSGYAVAATAGSITLPVVAKVPGSAGNVQAGMISQMATAIPGIDYVTNALPFAGGRDPESDAAFRARFQTFIQSRSLATPTAVANAVLSVQQGLTFSLTENVDGGGSPRPGNFVLTVNDGSGSPSSALLAAIQSAVEAVRPIGSTFSVQPPTIVGAAVQMSLQAPAGTASSELIAKVEGAIAAYVGSLAIGAALSITRLAQLAFDADSTIVNVTGIAINGVSQDLVPGAWGIVQLDSVDIS